LTEIKNNNAKKVILRPKAEESQKTRFYGRSFGRPSGILRTSFGRLRSLRMTPILKRTKLRT
ncbi:MAG: hypothetical protein U9Q08_04145, partial [Candidatus Omnitrophota bacterium]|nr:hypothetical protein [Candidatus Omnitrophota bacterium]